jgi:hypothetical protein
MEEKMKRAWDDPRANRGYVARGRERVTQETDPVKIAQMRISAPDAKESMEIGRDWDPTWKVSFGSVCKSWPLTNPEQMAPRFLDSKV